MICRYSDHVAKDPLRNLQEGAFSIRRVFESVCGYSSNNTINCLNPPALLTYSIKNGIIRGE